MPHLWILEMEKNINWISCCKLLTNRSGLCYTNAMLMASCCDPSRVFSHFKKTLLGLKPDSNHWTHLIWEMVIFSNIHNVLPKEYYIWATFSVKKNCSRVQTYLQKYCSLLESSMKDFPRFCHKNSETIHSFQWLVC